jgi:hypothetical protein
MPIETTAMALSFPLYKKRRNVLNVIFSNISINISGTEKGKTENTPYVGAFRESEKARRSNPILIFPK